LRIQRTGFIGRYQARVAATMVNQPHWATPLISGGGADCVDPFQHMQPRSDLHRAATVLTTPASVVEKTVRIWG
jgi:hypothetical protein